MAKELLSRGATVEIMCRGERKSDNERLIFRRSTATKESLEKLFSEKHYDGIINFLHYEELDEYKNIHPLLIENTDHLIFLSSYRVYADEQHPITETAPRLFDVIRDEEFLENEKYAVPKSKCEDYLYYEHADEPWTIVRPVISFSDNRLDLLMYSGHDVIIAARDGRELLLPQIVKDYVAGIDWAGNSGKLIANLLFKPDAIGETFTIYSGHNLTWGEVASVYQKLTGVKIRWCEEEEYLNFYADLQGKTGLGWGWKYDRCYNCDIDCSKVMRVTGLTKDDFLTVEEGLRFELEKLQ